MAAGSTDDGPADHRQFAPPVGHGADTPPAGLPVDVGHSRRTEPLEPGATAASEACGVCGTRRVAGSRFCEGCGLDVSTPVAPPRAWVAEVAVDRQLFDRVAADGVTFPTGRATVIVPIGAAEVTIGRSRTSRPAPDIDLSGALADPAVSHHHATLVRTASNTYEVVDVGSTNGTTVNDDPTPLVPAVATELVDGDRIHVGAWTTITVRLAGST